MNKFEHIRNLVDINGLYQVPVMRSLQRGDIVKIDVNSDNNVNKYKLEDIATWLPEHIGKLGTLIHKTQFEIWETRYDSVNYFNTPTSKFYVHPRKVKRLCAWRVMLDDFEIADVPLELIVDTFPERIR